MFQDVENVLPFDDNEPLMMAITDFMLDYPGEFVRLKSIYEHLKSHYPEVTRENIKNMLDQLTSSNTLSRRSVTEWGFHSQVERMYFQEKRASSLNNPK